MLAHQPKGLIDGYRGAFGERPLSLLDQDPAVEGGLQLFGEQFPLAAHAFLDQPDSRDVGERLADGDVIVVQDGPGRAEEVEGADHGVA